jgi:hypothetical protein
LAAEPSSLRAPIIRQKRPQRALTPLALFLLPTVVVAASYATALALSSFPLTFCPPNPGDDRLLALELNPHSLSCIHMPPNAVLASDSNHQANLRNKRGGRAPGVRAVVDTCMGGWEI